MTPTTDGFSVYPHSSRSSWINVRLSHPWRSQIRHSWTDQDHWRRGPSLPQDQNLWVYSNNNAATIITAGRSELEVGLKLTTNEEEDIPWTDDDDRTTTFHNKSQFSSSKIIIVVHSDGVLLFLLLLRIDNINYSPLSRRLRAAGGEESTISLLISNQWGGYRRCERRTHIPRIRSTDNIRSSIRVRRDIKID